MDARRWIVLLLLCACRSAATPPPAATPPAGANEAAALEVTLDRAAYVLGDTATVTVANRTARTLYFALVCDASVEGEVGGAWTVVFDPDCSNVRVRPTVVDPGASVELPFVVAPCDARALFRYSAFRLRLRFQLGGSDGYRTVYSPPFRVEAR
jgi:hypothetical protein